MSLRAEASESSSAEFKRRLVRPRRLQPGLAAHARAQPRPHPPRGARIRRTGAALGLPPPVSWLETFPHAAAGRVSLPCHFPAGCALCCLLSSPIPPRWLPELRCRTSALLPEPGCSLSPERGNPSSGRPHTPPGLCLRRASRLERALPSPPAPTVSRPVSIPFPVRLRNPFPAGTGSQKHPLPSSDVALATRQLPSLEGSEGILHKRSESS